MGCCGGREKLETNPLENNEGSFDNSAFNSIPPDKDKLMDASAARIPSMKTSSETKLETKPTELNISSYNLNDISNINNNQSVNASYLNDGLDQSNLNILGEIDEELSRVESESKIVLKGANIKQVVNKKGYFIIKIKKLLIYEKDFLLGMYPELNVVLLLDVDDSKINQRKIFFMRIKTSSAKALSYEPIPLKDDNFNIVLPCKESDRGINKISMCFYSYTLHKLLGLCNDEVYFDTKIKEEFVQYQMNRDFYMKNTNKKIGEVILDVSYCMSEENCEVFDEDKEREILFKFETKKDKSSKYEESPINSFVYHHIDNCTIRKEEDSIDDINYDDVYKEINKSKTWDDLISPLKKYNDKYRSYIIMTRLYKVLTHFISNNKVIDVEIYNTLIKLLYDRLSFISTYKDTNDVIFSPFLFKTLTDLIFNTKIFTSQNLQSFSDINCDILIQIFISSFDIMLPKNTKYPSSDIQLSCLLFLSNYLSNGSYSIRANSKIQNGSEFFFQLFISKRYHIKLLSLISKYYEYQLCIEPIFLLYSKMLKSKAIQSHNEELINEICNFVDVIKRILKIHECNNHIVTYSLQILLHCSNKIDNNVLCGIIKISKLKEMFAIYRRNGFEAIHDAIIQYMKCVIGKKNEISIDEFIDIIGILNYTVNYLKMKIKNIDSNNQVKMHKYICPCLSYLHTFANIINTSSYKKEMKVLSVMKEKKIIENIVELFTMINETEIFSKLDSFYYEQLIDRNLLNEKILIFRTLYHILSMMKNVIDKDTLIQMNKVIESIEQNKKLNPENAKEIYDKVKHESEIGMLIKSYKEYYAKFKGRKEELNKQ